MLDDPIRVTLAVPPATATVSLFPVTVPPAPLAKFTLPDEIEAASWVPPKSIVLPEPDALTVSLLPVTVAVAPAASATVTPLPEMV